MTKPNAASRRKYLERLGTAEDRIDQKLIPVYNSLHKKMKQAADQQGISMYEAYAQASRLYLQKAGFQIPGLGTLSADEKTLCEEVLQIYRNRSTNKVFDETITLVKSLVRMVIKTRA